MLELSAIKTDTTKVDNGVWWVVRYEGGNIVGVIEDKPGPDDAALLIVPMSHSYQRQLERDTEPHLAKLRRNALSDAEQDALLSRITGPALAKWVLRGWQNISINGEVTPWSEAKAAEILSMREWKVLIDFVVAAASHRNATLATQEEESAGN
jgi:hypothetical protein